MSKVVLYTTRYCPYCIRAKRLFDDKGVAYRDIAVDNDPDKRAEMIALSQRHTVPQIWVGQHHVGGFDDLWALERKGELDILLANAES